MMKEDTRIAYFSMEVAVDAEMPTYSGGLGVLAGDSLLSAADLKVPMVGVTLLHRRGYLRQVLDESGWQHEEDCPWDVGEHLEELEVRERVWLEDRVVWIRGWRRILRGASGGEVALIFLDVDLPENAERDRHYTDRLYLGDHYHRICQEVILGIGGVRLLRKMGYKNLERFHMNEGHAAFLTLELAREEREVRGNDDFGPELIRAIRRKCVFTTHTPVAAGHDQFEVGLVRQILGDLEPVFHHPDLFNSKSYGENRFNMTYLALNMSRYVNGVAKKHAEVSRAMFAGYEIDAVTNGVHAGRWVCQDFAELFDEKLAGWRQDNFLLRSALMLSREEVWAAHQGAKRRLFSRVKEVSGEEFSEEVLTLGFARRATAYKRPELLFENLDWLYEIAGQAGGLQLVFAGKAHPGDEQGKYHIQHIWQMREKLAEHGVRLVYLPDYGIELGALMTAGVDVWLNTPQPPMEASGTSGMKSALNGVPSLSVGDGWWLEGCLEDLTGWEVESGPQGGEARSLYSKLSANVVPMFRDRREEFIDMMKHCIALNGVFFNTQRMMLQYVERAYFRSVGE